MVSDFPFQQHLDNWIIDWCSTVPDVKGVIVMDLLERANKCKILLCLPKETIKLCSDAARVPQPVASPNNNPESIRRWEKNQANLASSPGLAGIVKTDFCPCSILFYICFVCLLFRIGINMGTCMAKYAHFIIFMLSLK